MRKNVRKQLIVSLLAGTMVIGMPVHAQASDAEEKIVLDVINYHVGTDYIDGAIFLQTFLHIILPLAKPGLVTIALLQFINTWNEFYFALMLTSGDRARTVPIALNYYMGTFANNYSALFAAVVMTVLPTILVFILLQRQVMESLTAGAVKG